MNVYWPKSSGKWNQESPGPHHSSNQQCCIINNLELTYDICNINFQRNKQNQRCRWKTRLPRQWRSGYSVRPASGILAVQIPAATPKSLKRLVTAQQQNARHYVWVSRVLRYVHYKLMPHVSKCSNGTKTSKQTNKQTNKTNKWTT